MNKFLAFNENTNDYKLKHTSMLLTFNLNNQNKYTNY